MKKNNNSKAAKRKQKKKHAREIKVKKKIMTKRRISREESSLKKEIWKIKREGEKEVNRLTNATIRKPSSQETE